MHCDDIGPYLYGSTCKQMKNENGTLVGVSGDAQKHMEASISSICIMHSSMFTLNEAF